ncbi:MAG: bifunctional glutamate N-acetyltransferase/amino-acid acetyltransferase ArgJ [Planctomycetota bacterium]
MEYSVPEGFRVAGVHAGIKRSAEKFDLSLIVGVEPCVAAGVYTQNRVFAAPVAVDRQRTPGDHIRVLVANSGNANACTGERGLQDALEMAGLAARACNAAPEQALVLSTGLIGEYLPMEKISAGIALAAHHLGHDEAALLNAARGILTTDRHEKIVARSVQLGTRRIKIVGFAKGAGMIGPKMATMLAVLLTDAPLHPDTAQRVLQQAVDESFNCISVEGHTSTNDSVILLASGKAGGHQLSGSDLTRFGETLKTLCVDLARMIPADGEGASHLITIDVAGCQRARDAQQIAKTVANSALVKTAVAGADPNWGRIVSAVGYAGVPFDPNQLQLYVNGTLLFGHGVPASFDPSAVSDSMARNRDTHIELVFDRGNAGTRFWTSDLTVDYVRINADYHT